MTVFSDMTAVEAAAFYIGLLTIVMLGLKLYVGFQRGRLRVAPGDMSNPDFARATRVQLNAVEDVPVLLVGIVMLAMLNAPLWTIHASGGALVIGRLAHALGLARSGGFSFGRAGGTMLSYLVYILLAWTLVSRALA